MGTYLYNDALKPTLPTATASPISKSAATPAPPTKLPAKCLPTTATTHAPATPTAQPAWTATRAAATVKGSPALAASSASPTAKASTKPSQATASETSAFTMEECMWATCNAMKGVSGAMTLLIIAQPALLAPTRCMATSASGTALTA